MMPPPSPASKKSPKVQVACIHPYPETGCQSFVKRMGLTCPFKIKATWNPLHYSREHSQVYNVAGENLSSLFCKIMLCSVLILLYFDYYLPLLLYDCFYFICLLTAQNSAFHQWGNIKVEEINKRNKEINIVIIAAKLKGKTWMEWQRKSEHLCCSESPGAKHGFCKRQLGYKTGPNSLECPLHFFCLPLRTQLSVFSSFHGLTCLLLSLTSYSRLITYNSLEQVGDDAFVGLVHLEYLWVCTSDGSRDCWGESMNTWGSVVLWVARWHDKLVKANGGKRESGFYKVVGLGDTRLWSI